MDGVRWFVWNSPFAPSCSQWANTALHHAAQAGHLYVVWLLLKWKADPLRLNKVGELAEFVSGQPPDSCFFPVQRGDSALALARDAEYTELDEFLVRRIPT